MSPCVKRSQPCITRNAELVGESLAGPLLTIERPTAFNGGSQHFPCAHVGGKPFLKTVETISGPKDMASGSVSSWIRSAARTSTLPNPDNVEARWDTKINVEVERHSDTFRRINPSDVGCRQEVASSRIGIRGRCRSARAIARR
jgi:hypothetical protein